MRDYYPGGPWLDEDLERDTRRENPPEPPLVLEPAGPDEFYCGTCGDWFPDSQATDCPSCFTRHHAEDLHLCPDTQEGA